MSDSIPSLRRKLDEANAEIKKLRLAQPAEVVVERKVYVDREVKVPGPERVVYKRVETEKVVYVDNPEHLRTIELLQERLAECQNISQSDS